LVLASKRGHLLQGDLLKAPKFKRSDELLDADLARRVRDSLYAQHYNLLLGAGASLDSTDRRKKKLLGAEELRKNLCTATQSRESSPLWRVAGLLSAQQIQSYLTEPYLGCLAGPTLQAITRFVWKQAFTLNIDDALENAYERDPTRLQSIVPVNYTREFETFRNPQELPVIHLHGFVRSPADKYVFSLQEYASAQAGMNAWVHVLSQLIVTEPFIIAGTALFEPDLEYFIAHRPSSSQVLARAPSILVEPFPDAGTRRDCDRLNLVLVEATLVDFLAWMAKEFGPAPTPLALIQPQDTPRSISVASTFSRTAFWSDFDFVTSGAPASTKLTTSAFTFGRPPSWDDLKERRDVPLQEQLPVVDEVRRWQDSSEQSEFVCLEGFAGSGISTSVRRIAIDLTTHGLQVFHLKAHGNFDMQSAVEVLVSMADPLVITTESLAEHGDQLIDLYLQLRQKKKRVCFVGGERQYRMRLVREILSEVQARYLPTGEWRLDERTELIKRYLDLGLIGDSNAIDDPRKFSTQIAKDTVAEAVCRILNDFRPLRTIVRSLWNDTTAGGRPAYLATALAYYCHPVGVRRDVIAGLYRDDLVADLAMEHAPLRLLEHPDDSDFLIPANPTLASLLIQELARVQPDRLLQVIVELANAIEPLVTRHTIKQRTAEARLAGRLFDADGLMPDLVKDRFDRFFELTNDKWRWNSRYWEQRALWVGSSNRPLSIQHARHAVSIERHPFPLTTLAQVLFAASAESEPFDAYFFGEALDLIEETMKIEANWERGRTRASYRALLEGVSGYLDAGGQMNQKQKDFAKKTIADLIHHFSRDPDFTARGERVLASLSQEKKAQENGALGTPPAK
jgi:hypothetical protein